MRLDLLASGTGKQRGRNAGLLGDLGLPSCDLLASLIGGSLGLSGSGSVCELLRLSLGCFLDLGQPCGCRRVVLGSLLPLARLGLPVGLLGGDLLRDLSGFGGGLRGRSLGGLLQLHRL